MSEESRFATFGGYVGLAEFSKRMGKPYTTMHGLVRRGEIPGVVKLGGKYYVPGQVVEALEQGRPIPPIEVLG